MPALPAGSWLGLCLFLFAVGTWAETRVEVGFPPHQLTAESFGFGFTVTNPVPGGRVYWALVDGGTTAVTAVDVKELSVPGGRCYGAWSAVLHAYLMPPSPRALPASRPGRCDRDAPFPSVPMPTPPPRRLEAADAGGRQRHDGRVLPVGVLDARRQRSAQDG